MDYTNSKTKEDAKDYWRTAPNAIYDAARLLGIKHFSIDAAAKDCDVAVCHYYISESEDAISVPNWFSYAPISLSPFPVAWCNPPFSLKSKFLEKAFEQSQFGFVMMMLPFSPATKWWRDLITGKATAVFVPNGRYGFLNPDTGEYSPGAKFPTCFVLFSPLKTTTAWVEFERTTEKEFEKLFDQTELIV